MMYNKKKSTFEKKYPIGRIPHVNLMTSGSVNDWLVLKKMLAEHIAEYNSVPKLAHIWVSIL